MAAANDPAPPTSATNGAKESIQTAAPPTSPAGIQAPPAEPPIKLPPQARAPQLLEEQAVGVARLNQALVAAVLALAFLLASFAVRNPDFWMHLASGRAQVAGTYRPWTGQDPFAYTTAGTYWVNHSWLYDLGLYGLWQALGGPAVVVLKGLLAVAIAWTLLQIRRRGQDLWLPAVFTGLALLALSPRLFLQPTVFSYLFLAVTLWLLQRSAPEGDAGTPAAEARPKALWLLPALFVLWVNLDAWFVLGLLAVTLYVVGEALQGRVLAAPGEAPPPPPAADPRLRRLGLVLVASVVACLVNPHLWRVFALPPDLSLGGAAAALAEETGFKAAFTSPFSDQFWTYPTIGGNVAGLTFFPLAALGITSFLMAWPRFHWGRALLWAAFFALASWRWHAVPFFALVGGPIAALNFGDYLAQKAWRKSSPYVPAAAFLVLLVALLLMRQNLPVPETVVAAVVLGVAALRLAWVLFGSQLRTGRGPAPGPEPLPEPPAEARSWAPAVQIAVVLAVILLGLKLSTLTTFYTDKLGWPALPVPFLVFAGFVVGLLAFGLVPTLAYFDRVFVTWSLGGRALTLLAGVALLLAAWPGWLNGARQDPTLARHAGWAVEPDPSLRGIAERLGALRQEGVLGADDHGYAVVPQVASYCAWFCPQERGFFDHRYTLFAEQVPVYLDVRHALDQLSKRPAEDEPGKLQELQERQRVALYKVQKTFRERHINHLVLTYNDPISPPVRLLVSINPLLTAPDWRLVYLDGRSAIFGWTDPDGKESAARWDRADYRPKQLAFGPDDRPERAPEKGAPDPVNVPDWVHYMTGTPPPPLQVDESTMHLIRFSGVAPYYGDQADRDFRTALAAALVASTTPNPGPLAAAGLAGFRFCVDGFYLEPPDKQQRPHSPMVERLVLVGERLPFFLDRDDGPPELPLLAIRAARRAVAEDPQSLAGYLCLHDAYSTQHYQTRERAWADALPELAFLRHVQMVAALQHALTLQADVAPVHAKLADLYARFRTEANGQQGYLDLQLNQLREAAKLVKRAGPQPEETEEGYGKRLKTIDRQVEELGKEVSDRQNRYVVWAHGKSGVLEKAREALKRGLAEQALNELLASDAVEFGPAGAQLELELLLTTGRLDDARRMLNDSSADFKAGLGEAVVGPYAALPAYPWYQLVLAAAEGNYHGADEQCEELIKARAPNLEVVARLLGMYLEEVPRGKPVAAVAAGQVHRMLQSQALLRVGAAVQQRATLMVLHGLLLLEAGDTDRAAEAFRAAGAAAFPPDRYLPFLAELGAPVPLGTAALLPACYEAASGPVFDFNGRAAANHYLQLLDEAAARRR